MTNSEFKSGKPGFEGRDFQAQGFLPSIQENLPGGGTRTIDPVSLLFQERQILLNGAVDSQSASLVTLQLLALQAQDGNKPITLYINSPGGSCSDGLAIYDVMRSLTCPVYTVAIGLAASMGAFLLSSGKRGHRYAMPNAKIMIHQPLVPGGQGGGISGQATDIMIAAKDINDLKRRLNKIMAANCGEGMTERRMANLTNRDNSMWPEQAIKLGLIDNILQPKW
ncbi:MAG: ATP-dependent Clp protease proteolytic subunit [Candidatus Obscuribacter sp.]|nr:ATP-dependent Clp protease proteolytic subunit [Candidatus Obscuribacter sp.]